MGGMGALQGVFALVSSLGQLTELLGMGTESLSFLFGSVMGFLETLGHLATQLSRPAAALGLEAEDEAGEAHLDEHERVQRERARKGVRLLRWIVGGLASYLAYKLLRRAARRWLGLGRGLGLLTAAVGAGAGGLQQQQQHPQQQHPYQGHLAYGAYPSSLPSAASGGAALSEQALEQAFRMSSSSSSSGGSGSGSGRYQARQYQPYNRRI
jgi:hypothetical protein